MILNWIKIFIYHLKQNKLFSLLNTLGLSIGIAGIIFSILYWNDEHSYDKWNPEKDKIYSVLNDLGGGNVWTVNSAATAPYLKATSSQLDEYCYMRDNYMKSTVIYNGKIFVIEKFFSAQSNYFSFFPYEFIKGDRKTALHDRNSIVFSEKTASRIFKNEDPMGKTVKYENKMFVVRGIYRLNEKSSSMPEAITTVIEEDLKNDKENWGFNYGLMLKLKNRRDTTIVSQQLNNIYVEYNYKKQAQNEGMTYEAFVKAYGNPTTTKLLSLPDARLYRGNYSFPEKNGNLQLLQILVGLSILILILSIVNYINLATANAIKRAKEVGVRKVVGASKLQIIYQFIFETVLTTLFSILLALVIVELSLPFYNSFLNKYLVIIGSQFFVQLIFIFIIVVFVSGVLPAVYISNFETLKVLKGNFSRSKSGVWLRNGMLVLQFAIATFFIIGSFIVYQQVRFMSEKDLGFKGAQVMDIVFKPQKGKRQYDRYKIIKQHLQKIKGVESVSAGLFSIGSMENSWSGLVYKDHKEVITQQMGIDFGMLENLGIKLVSGRYLTDKLASDSISNVLLNEASAKTLLEKDPLNKEIYWQSKKFKVVGIVKDFNYFDIKYNVNPMIFLHISSVDFMKDNMHYITVKVAPENMTETIANLEKYWKTNVDAEYPFEYNFVDKNFARSFKDYEDQRNLFSLLNIIVILIAIFGLFALASYSMDRRLREIAIRKTLGAPTNILLKELSKQYIIYCIIGFIIGVFPAYLLLKKWLEDFAYRIEIPLLPFIIAFVSLLALTLIIVLGKAYQVTKIDVLKYLKYE